MVVQCPHFLAASVLRTLFFSLLLKLKNSIEKRVHENPPVVCFPSVETVPMKVQLMLLRQRSKTDGRV